MCNTSSSFFTVSCHLHSYQNYHHFANVAQKSEIKPKRCREWPNVFFKLLLKVHLCREISSGGNLLRQLNLGIFVLAFRGLGSVSSGDEGVGDVVEPTQVRDLGLDDQLLDGTRGSDRDNLDGVVPEVDGPIGLSEP